MTHSDFRKRLSAQEKLLGTMVTIPSSAVAEALSISEFDWLFVDCEHGPIETTDLREILPVVGKNAECLVRIPALDEVYIKKALDLGASGIIAPQINTAEQARKVVEFSRYPSAGSRGIGLARAHGFGKAFQNYIENANDQIAVVVQAEHRVAVENIESIIAVPGVDCILIGPYDLSASLGMTGCVDAPEVVAAIEHVESRCKSAGMPLGIFGLTADSVKPYIERGFSLVCVGIDTVLLANSAARINKQLRS